MNITTVRDALAVRLDTIPNLRPYARVPSDLTPPAAILEPPVGEYDLDFNDGMTVTFPVVLVASRAPGDDRAQQELDTYLATTGASSIKATIQKDPQLDDTCDEATVVRFYDYGGTYQIGGIDYASVTIEVRVIG